MPETPKKHPLKLKITNKTPKAKFLFFNTWMLYLVFTMSLLDSNILQRADPLGPFVGRCVTHHDKIM